MNETVERVFIPANFRIVRIVINDPIEESKPIRVIIFGPLSDLSIHKSEVSFKRPPKKTLPYVSKNSLNMPGSDPIMIVQLSFCKPIIETNSGQPLRPERLSFMGQWPQFITPGLINFGGPFKRIRFLDEDSQANFPADISTIQTETLSLGNRFSHCLCMPVVPKVSKSFDYEGNSEDERFVTLCQSLAAAETTINSISISRGLSIHLPTTISLLPGLRTITLDKL